MHWFRIEAQPHAALLAEFVQFIEQILSDDAFAVITHDHSISTGKLRSHGSDYLLCEWTIQFATRFAIHADNLLFVRNDASLDARMPRCARHQPAAADAMLI